ncbi:MAG: SDR family NAD(P)-dependent oxidoreductase [Gemmatimonadaceae bacterium]
MSELDRTLAERHAMVTGANRGIGAAIAMSLSQLGATVTLLVRDRESGERAQALLPGKSYVVAADITDEDAVANACVKAMNAMGTVDILVNNAGSVESAPFLRTDRAVFERMLAVHLYGPMAATRALLPNMMTQKFGRVVNIASIAGVAGAPYITAYCAAKHAMVGLTRSLAKEVITSGITVNAVCPGYTETDMVTSGIANITARTGRSAEDALSAMLSNSPLKRLVKAEEVASSVAWLCSAGAASVTGQTIVIDGGELA